MLYVHQLCIHTHFHTDIQHAYTNLHTCNININLHACHINMHVHKCMCKQFAHYFRLRLTELAYKFMSKNICSKDKEFSILPNIPWYQIIL